MLVLARSLPKLRLLTILFFKRADSSMLNAQVCEGYDNVIVNGDNFTRFQPKEYRVIWNFESSNMCICKVCPGSNMQNFLQLFRLQVARFVSPIQRIVCECS